LLVDAQGNLYGTTLQGSACCAAYVGVVFKLDSTGKETILHSFIGGPGTTDGVGPSGGLVRDFAGNLYGTTGNGGTSYGGVVFKLDPAGKETILHDFAGPPADSSGPNGLVRDLAGNLYGTTTGGSGADYGVVFKVEPSGKETILHRFTGMPSDGSFPSARPLRDFAGNLYGTTDSGGTSGWGVVYKIDPNGNETILYSFHGGAGGGTPLGGELIRDFAGNLYGTTYQGGASNNGVVFKLDPMGQETVLYSFAGGPADGANPEGGLVRDFAGNLRTAECCSCWTRLAKRPSSTVLEAGMDSTLRRDCFSLQAVSTAQLATGAPRTTA
jgi:uncharacterized repeat protein (TIGR03803 family)